VWTFNRKLKIYHYFAFAMHLQSFVVASLLMFVKSQTIDECNFLVNLQSESHPDECPGAIDPMPCSASCAEGDLNCVTCPTCSASVVETPRVRKEWQTLSETAKTAFFEAMKLMKSTPTAEGQVLYGPTFFTYDWFVQIHIASILMAGGGPNPKVANAPYLVDYAHSGHHFSVWHTIFVFKFEESLLAIDPTLGAMPYFDFRKDIGAPFGPGATEWGSLAGTGPESTVIDGALKDWTVGTGDPTLPFFAGSLRPTMYYVTEDHIVRYANAAPYETSWILSAESYEECANEANMHELHSSFEDETHGHFHLGSHFFIAGFADGSGTDCIYPHCPQCPGNAQPSLEPQHVNLY
jgi:hypothetical protein